MSANSRRTFTLIDELTGSPGAPTVQRICRALGVLLHYSDQVSQYASHDFADSLAVLVFKPSMSRRGSCYDNAAMESFWATLKAECFDREIPATRQQARSMIFDYIESFYKPRRRHCSLGYISPAQFEQRTQSRALF